MNKKDFRIIYMGTPDFAVEPLKKLVENNYNVVGVVTNPDKPAGRGQKLQESAVKIYAQEQELKILQPEKFRNEDFIRELKNLNADLQIVVAFKMLPEIVWSMPKYGTLNLHASLLPQYRGAAPINWAIINGEEKTGITTFFLKHEIDTGNIIFQEEVEITPVDNAGDLHDKLMLKGADLVIKTVDAIINDNFHLTEQQKLFGDNSEIKHAPKIFKNDCFVNWSIPVDSIYNLIRGLSPYPTAWSEIITENQEKIQVKIFKSEKEIIQHKQVFGTITSDQKTYIKVAANGGYIHILELQLAGKKRLSVSEFLRGFQNINHCFFSTNLE